MKKTFKKVLCVFLSVLMLMGSMAAIASAADEFVYGAKYYAQRTQAESAAVCLDAADEALGNIDPEIKYTIHIPLIGDIGIDATSVNKLCKSIDDVKNYFQSLKGLLGDLKDLNLSNWKTGLQRGAKYDEVIVSNLIQLLADNSSIIAKLADGSLNLGALNSAIDTNFLGDDGLSGMVTGLIVGLVYDEGSAKYKTAYNSAKTDLDSFIYNDMIPELLAGEDDALPGFTMNASSTVDDLLHSVFNVVWDKYLAGMIKGINVDVNTIESADLKALANVADLDCSDFDTNITIDANKTFLEQINDIIGFIATQFLKDKSGFTWVSGSYDKIGTNIKNLLVYLAEKSGLVANASQMSYDELVLKIFGIVLNNVDLGNYGAGLSDCKSIEEIARAALINTAAENNIGTTYTSKSTYLDVAGDILAWWANKYMDLTDTSGKAYKQGGGADVYEVANYIANYYLIDKGFANLLGISIKNTDTVFSKIDKIVDLFAADKSMAFDSKTFVTTLVADVLKLDIQGIIDITIVDALNAANDISGVEMVYKAVVNFVNNIIGSGTLAAYKATKPFTNLVSNASLKTSITKLLSGLNSKKSKMLPAGFYGIGIIVSLGKNKFSLESVNVPDQAYTGKAVMPTGVTVKVKDSNGKVETLTQGKDFEVTSTDVNYGDATAKIAVEGKYSGIITAPFKIVFGKVGKVTVGVSTTKVKLTWGAVPDASSYSIYAYNGSKWVKAATVTSPTYTFSGLTAGTTYYYRVLATNKTYGNSAYASVTASTALDKVAGLKKTAVTSSTATLAWTSVSGATAYQVYQYISKKWVKVAASKTNSVTVKGLAADSTNYFKVCAYNSASIGGFSSTVAIKTNIAQVTGLKSAVTSTTATLVWTKVSGATSYQVYQYISKKWVKVATVKTNAAKISKLAANSSNYFKVRAVGATVGDLSSTFTVKTGVAKVSGLKVSAVTSTAAKLTWTKVSGATSYQVYQYISKKWVKVAAVKTNAATITGLKANSSNVFKVRAVGSAAGDFSSNLTVKTAVAKVTGLKSSSVKTTSLKLTWTKVSGAAGYVVYRNGKAIKNIKSGSTVSFTDSKLSKNTSYKYTVRAFQVVSKKVVYGDASSSLSVRTKLF